MSKLTRAKWGHNTLTPLGSRIRPSWHGVHHWCLWLHEAFPGSLLCHIYIVISTSLCIYMELERKILFVANKFSYQFYFDCNFNFKQFILNNTWRPMMKRTIEISLSSNESNKRYSAILICTRVRPKPLSNNLSLYVIASKLFYFHAVLN